MPTEESAEKVSTTLTRDGYKTNVEKTTDGDSWLVFAIKNIVPSEETLVNIRKELEEVVSADGGNYDKWGSPIVK